jgi:small subunit ribosomal protein S6
LVTVLRPDIGDEEVQTALDRVHDAVKSRGGEVQDVNQWGRRKLAYPIRRYLEGNFILSNIHLEPERTAELERGLLLSEDVIRHLLVRLDE